MDDKNTQITVNPDNDKKMRDTIAPSTNQDGYINEQVDNTSNLQYITE